ncbi:restriction endonuclease subunit S [Algoriphagus confluentis]|uniref:Restriction endonuclease subunit S n=1 Tax=Algoriphagus confluentis TaxID=1697556 RepID=A0ABQ6PMQ6_9BACT|nr:restriction endonuclease subunit S [Algoriphagus confluentis]
MEATIENVGFQTYSDYKESGVEWLGEIPLHWNMKRFKYLADYHKGKLPKKITSEWKEGLYPYMSMEYLRGGAANQWVLDMKIKNVEKGEILLLWDGSNSGEFIKSRQGVISSTVAHIKFFNIDKRYAWYYSFKIEQKLRNETIGMGIPHVDGGELNNTYVLIPSPNEQTAIADFLDKKTALIDKAIQIKQKQIALLQERRQILIQQAVTRGLNPNVPLKDSAVDWIGMIPEHWEVCRNSNIYSESKKPGNDSLKILSVSIHTGVSSEELSDEENIRGAIRIEDKSSYKLVEPNDITFNMMRAWQGGIGAVKVRGMVSPAYVVASPKCEINSEFFEFQYRTPEFIQQMDRFSKGITDFRKRLYWAEFKQLITVLPPYKEQLQIVGYINDITLMTKKITTLKEQEIEKLKEFKSTLINSAVTGKIKVAGV